MDRLDATGVRSLIAALADLFRDRREALIALDAPVGDSDLGITMAKGFAAAAEAVAAADASAPPGRLFQLAGAAIAKAAPSTMGTLTATGFLRGAKALGDAEALGASEAKAFWRAYRDGIQERGKAKPGDKTVLDALDPACTALEAAVAAGAALPQALAAAAGAAEAGVEATRAMVPRHGKAATFQDRALGLPDAGATVGALILRAWAAAAEVPA